MPKVVIVTGGDAAYFPLLEELAISVRALRSADQIGLAVVATTATIVVVFTPVSFMGSIPGQFFREFGITSEAVVAAAQASLESVRGR